MSTTCTLITDDPAIKAIAQELHRAVRLYRMSIASMHNQTDWLLNEFAKGVVGEAGLSGYHENMMNSLHVIRVLQPMAHRLLGDQAAEIMTAVELKITPEHP